MKVLIIGAGRMGVRHLQGVLAVKEVENVTILDINQAALDAVSDVFQNDPRLRTALFAEYKPASQDACIIASTARNRKPLIDLAVACSCKNLMIEKPLGQSYKEVEDLVAYLDTLPLTTVVNLNMRQYECIKKLARDLVAIPQAQGPKTITLNTGTLGIGCNGIHYLDKMFFILGADRAKIVDAEVEDTIIPSGRGGDFCDFGGWAVIKFYEGEQYVGRALISMAATSTVFGGWEIVAPFARFSIDEIAATRTTILRKEDSQMPMNRYAADFGDPIVEKYEAPFLGDLTTAWIEGLLIGKNELPQVKESLKAHKLMFDWLSYSKTHKDIFPIT